MTKHDAIRDGVILNITKACPDMLNSNIVMLADKILRDEDSQGVVIKVDRECNHKWILDSLVMDTNPPIYTSECALCHEVQQTGLDGKWHKKKAGYVAVEPLVIEDNVT